MIDEMLCGSWDQPTSTIVMHETQPTRLQDLCAQFTEKAGVLVDLNERALQLRTGGQREADEEGGRFGEGGNFQGSRRYIEFLHCELTNYSLQATLGKVWPNTFYH